VIWEASTKIGNTTVRGASSSGTCSSLIDTKKLPCQVLDGRLVGEAQRLHEVDAGVPADVGAEALGGVGADGDLGAVELRVRLRGRGELLLDRGLQLVGLLLAAQRPADQVQLLLPGGQVRAHARGLADGRRDGAERVVALLRGGGAGVQDEVGLQRGDRLGARLERLDDLRGLVVAPLGPPADALSAEGQPVARAHRLDAQRQRGLGVRPAEGHDPLGLLRDLDVPEGRLDGDGEGAAGARGAAGRGSIPGGPRVAGAAAGDEDGGGEQGGAAQGRANGHGLPFE